MNLTTTALLDLSHTLAGDYLSQFQYPWEALDGIKELILQLGPALDPAVVSEAEITIKYAGYIERQLRQVEEVRRLEERAMPEDIDYLSIAGLRLEARQKLDAIRPKNLGQAGRVSGVSPADVAVLMVYLKQSEQ